MQENTYYKNTTLGIVYKVNWTADYATAYCIDSTICKECHNQKGIMDWGDIYGDMYKELEEISVVDFSIHHCNCQQL
jgi:hypothetical protein